MIGIASLFGFISGVGANQLDALLLMIRDRGWELISRYIVGIVGMFPPFALLIYALNPKAVKDATIGYWSTAILFGLGVAAARSLKDLAESKPR